MVDGMTQWREGERKEGHHVLLLKAQFSHIDMLYLFHLHENPLRSNLLIPIAQMGKLRHREVKENIRVHTTVNGGAGRWPTMLIMQLVFMFSCPG
jgi:hypothetical protein